MNPFDEAAREAGRALGDIGAGEGSAFVDEVAETLAELNSDPGKSTRRRSVRRGASRPKDGDEGEAG